MQQPTSFGGALSASLTAHNTKEAFKDQQEGAQEIDSAVDKFKRWLTQENILSYYEDLRKTYQDVLKREAAYVAYAKTPPPSSMILAPAGYRLPENRTILPSLGSVMKKYKEINEILGIHGSFASTIVSKITETRRIADLTNKIADWRGKYMNNIRVGQAPPEVIKQVDKNDAIVTGLQAQLETVRSGITLYLTTMGIAKDAITDDRNDLEDMAEAVEEILANETGGKKLDSGVMLGQALCDFVATRYTASLDDQHNPFTMPLIGTSQKIIGVPVQELETTLRDYRQELLTAAQKIRDRALPKNSAVGSPDVYINPTMIPPDIEQIEDAPQPHRYMYPGYLGYWLQQIVDHLHEITLMGADIISARLFLATFAGKLKNECLTAATLLFPDLASEPIINDITVSTINPDALVAAIQSAPENNDALLELVTTKYQELITSNQKTVTRIREKNPMVLLFASDTYPNGVPELFKLRRTMLVIALLKSIAQKQPFGPDTYTSDLFGELQDPETLFPQCAGAASAAGEGSSSDVASGTAASGASVTTV